MRILTKEGASEVLSGKSPDSYVAQLKGHLRLVRGTFAAPVKSGVQIVLSKLLAYVLWKESHVCIYVTSWSIATEHLDLFYGYRRSKGENRPLIEAPIHLFQPTDQDALVSVLCVALLFSWDASIFDLRGKSLVQTSHDGWLEVRTNDEVLAKNVALEFDNYHMRLLGR
jgi:hypothetical protein